MTVPAFPTLKGLGYPGTRSPIWPTDKQISVSGKRTTLARQSYPRYAYELPYSVLRADNVNLELQTLLAFYNSLNGPALPFHYTDPDDNTATLQAFATGDGVTQNFQLVRAMAGVGVSFVEPVSWPTAVAVFENGTLRNPGTYTVSATGNVFCNLTAGHVLTWTGTYDWLCRFDDDSATFELFMSQLYRLKKIKFSTEKV